MSQILNMAKKDNLCYNCNSKTHERSGFLECDNCGAWMWEYKEMSNIDEKALSRKDDECVLEIKDYQWSTLGELLSYNKMQEILKNPDDYYFEFGYDDESEPPYMRIMRFGDKK